MPHFIIVLTSIFAVAVLGLSIHRTHLLSALLCLEGMMLSIFIGMSLWSTHTCLSSPLFYPILTLTLSACEAGLGLSLMIATARTHGSDNLTTLNLLQC
uniref:NADH-ubiquinone oxidoreductase chain 4L n=2 Tax=Heleophryne TaxID=32643 RepID=K9JYT8_HELRE|nr:NADH dehydrogenase subunit 4L [Heleophryne regis]AEC33144.1 NADH dehydrogenase subunit 4L [Heleophryne regis]AGN71212.1 NADH dehydrogenase subunit 4L [Heleophryne purcelli]